MRKNILLAALSALTFVTAQNQNFTINPGAVDPSTRSDWCNAEYNTCKLLCGGDPTANECDTDTLDYKCTCSNGTAPGLDYYTQTMPTFICEQAYADCIAANTGNARGQDNCTKTIKDHCGTLDPNKAQVGGGSSETTTSSPSTTATHAASGASHAPSSATSTAAAAPTNAAHIGNGVALVAAGLFAALL
ncbi:hypothetical protein VTK56DRAFT_1731 [Thermocarpiscus australiensis]